MEAKVILGRRWHIKVAIKRNFFSLEKKISGYERGKVDLGNGNRPARIAAAFWRGQPWRKSPVTGQSQKGGMRANSAL